jgi:hypothetical protein
LTRESVAARQLLLNSGRVQAVIQSEMLMSGDRQNNLKGNK